MFFWGCVLLEVFFGGLWGRLRVPGSQSKGASLGGLFVFGGMLLGNGCFECLYWGGFGVIFRGLCYVFWVGELLGWGMFLVCE